jgi:general secretion pathway protein K
MNTPPVRRARAGGRRRGGQRGIALLTAILLVALATMAATAIAFNNAMTARRGAAAFAFDAGLQYARGAEALAAYALIQDASQANRQDDFTKPWAQPFGPVEIADGVMLEAHVDDPAGRFNLNDLVDNHGVDDPDAIAQLERIFQMVGLETKWASLIADWIDADTVPLPAGGEDSLYLSQLPPYRPPNMAITSVSELLALPAFGRDNYLKVEPYLTALPRGTPLNLCTAPGIVLDSLFESQRQYSLDPEGLAKNRNAGCFPTKTVISSILSPVELQKVGFRIGEQSDYFQLRSYVSIGTAEFALYSLLHREGSGAGGALVRVVARSYGTE